MTAEQIDYTAWRPIEDYRPKARKEIAESAKDLLWQARDLADRLERLTDPDAITPDAIDAMAEYDRGGSYGTVYGITTSSLHKDLSAAFGALEDAESEMSEPCKAEGCAETATMQRGYGETLALACAEHAT